MTQKLDHFDPTNKVTFQQRYFVSYRYHNKNKKNSNGGGPIIPLLNIGGEGPRMTKSVLIDSHICSGDILELAKRILKDRHKRTTNCPFVCVGTLLLWKIIFNI